MLWVCTRFDHRPVTLLKTPGPYFRFEVPHISPNGSGSLGEMTERETYAGEMTALPGRSFCISQLKAKIDFRRTHQGYLVFKLTDFVGELTFAKYSARQCSETCPWSRPRGPCSANRWQSDADDSARTTRAPFDPISRAAASIYRKDLVPEPDSRCRPSLPSEHPRGW